MTGVVRFYLAAAVIQAAGLVIAAWRLITRRHATQPEPPAWVNDGHIDILAAWERDLRTPGLLEQAIAEELHP